MSGYGPASESLRLAEHYRQMTEGELIQLAQYPSSLTEMAQGALQQEIASRRLRVPLPEVPATPEPPPDTPDEGSPYAEERQLVVVCTVYSLRDALQVQRILDIAGIPFYMGPEKAMGIEGVRSNYGDGVDVKVMRIGAGWAVEALARSYEPKDEPREQTIDWDDGVAIRCPRCRSEDVVFERLSDNTREKGPASPTFHWRCGSCGHSWEDDGIAK